MSAKSIHLIRHAESTWNVERRMQGHANPPLTERGQQQLAQLAQAMREAAFDLVVSSDLERALLTARAVAKERNAEILVSPAWREHDMGEWTGLTREEIQLRWPVEYARYRSGDTEIRPGGGESRTDFHKRVVDARMALDIEHPGKALVVVTHRGPIRVLAPDRRPAHTEVIPIS